MPYNFKWLPFTESLSIDMGILLDPISVMMLVVISTVSLLVHIYSFGYMKGERGFQRYYAFLSLFTMSMLGLVVATNIFQMYLFWELVGVSSYLLIGFYYTKPAAIAASKKAFIVTRFADLGSSSASSSTGTMPGRSPSRPTCSCWLPPGATLWCSEPRPRCGASDGSRPGALWRGIPHRLKARLAAGARSFAAARQAAVEAVCPGTGLAALLDKPNNNLAVEYCKAILELGASLVPIPLPRQVPVMGRP